MKATIHTELRTTFEVHEYNRETDEDSITFTYPTYAAAKSFVDSCAGDAHNVRFDIARVVSRVEIIHRTEYSLFKTLTFTDVVWRLLAAASITTTLILLVKVYNL